MVRIAICDDDKNSLHHLEQLLYECFEELHSGCQVAPFLSAEQLLQGTGEKPFDLYILDIMMPGTSGITLAKGIYERNRVSAIVFLTSSPEFAVDSYEVEALDYLLKPVKKERLMTMLSKYLCQRQTRKDEEIIIQHKNSMTRIVLHALSYLECLNHQVIYHTSDNQEIICRQTLQEAEALLLCHKNFFKINRSQIVNLDHINKIHAGRITMKNGAVVYASRANVGSLTEAYLKYKLGKI